MASGSGKSKKLRQTWDKSAMKEAIAAIKEKRMGYLKASKLFNVPKTTLRRLLGKTDQPLEEAVSSKLGRKPILLPELEGHLVEYILTMEAKYFGLTRNDIRSLAFQLAVKNNISHPFSLLKQTAGRDWLRLFLRRHPSLSFRQPTGTSMARVKGFTRENVDYFYDLLEKEMNANNFEPGNIYNVDETGISVVPAKMPKVLGLKGKKQIGALTSAERGSLITCILCMSAAGMFIPPMFIFPRKRDNPLLMKGAPPGSIHANHPSGWVQTNLFTKWFEHFLKTVKPSSSSPVLLIMDGHSSHMRNIELIDLARKNDVHLLSIPPHSSHKIQPLDRTFMGPLKKYLTEEIRRWMINNVRPLTHFDIVELFGRAYLRTQTGETAIKGFESTGIYPFDRHVFKDHDFLGAEEIDEVAGGTESVQSKEKADKAECYNTSEPGPSGITTSFVMPHEISPIPVRRKKSSNRGRKPGKSEIISSSPYKQALEKSIKEKKLKEAKKGAKKPKKDIGQKGKQNVTKRLKFNKGTKNKNQPVETDTSSENEEEFSPDDESEPSPDRTLQEDAKCIYCSGFFSEDARGEKWIQCVYCKFWAHEDCSGNEKEYFVCEFCSC